MEGLVDDLTGRGIRVAALHSLRPISARLGR